MTHLTINQILRDISNNRYYRILWIDEGYQLLYFIAVLDKGALPIPHSVSKLHKFIEGGSWEKVEKDSFVSYREPKNEKEKQLRDEAWELIGSLVTIEPDIYKSGTRGKLLKDVIQKLKVTKPRVYRLLRKYWQNGMHPNALLPSQRGRKRNMQVAEYKSKVGRPRKDGNTGLIINNEVLKVIERYGRKHYINNRKATIRHAYEMMIKEYFSDYEYYENGVLKRVIQDPNRIPTLRQFRYHLRKLFSQEVTIKKRSGSKKFDREYRGKTGSVLSEVMGPGARFEIDATVGNVYLVSRFNRGWGIGRPIVYFVIDVYSRLIVGVYVGLDHPSWNGVTMAIMNTAQNKVDFCKDYGIEITEEKWPSAHMPERFLTDRGEALYKGATSFIEGMNIAIDHTASYRADMKGTIERSFASLDATLKPFLPGYIDSDFRERGAEDYRKQATLTVEQYTQIIIYFILHHNNRYMREYKRNKEMIEQDVAPNPVGLWNWGIKNQSGKLRSFSQEYIHFCLLPRAQATVTQYGIKFKKMHYTCNTAISEQWFTRAAMDGNWKVKIAYNPRNLNNIYLILDEEGYFEKCELLEKDVVYRDRWLEELEDLWGQENEQKRQKEHEQLQAKIDFIAEIESVIQEAKKEEKKQSQYNDKTRNIRMNRALENAADNSRDLSTASENKLYSSINTTNATSNLYTEARKRNLEKLFKRRKKE
ncbi:Mu transposase C-terminal domain-containing protein [Bacillus sp. B1-WWTP-T-0.5-Post-4]|uniref:Mu transposase C-terminal domain-containing protein n=1 Tax=Bacillus sp. B1-WWTP-T-0.5-Post-4 TaxID=2653219 RepID=UPI001262607E|nr:Mu transposase C-terminal domain-containing protein [Bacillus sp. B1-WWTP-T-0.5-Post-4]KAB7678404.1 transposase [Bacillus sp. B1-WWTP-T-0.5-Post-4]